jgi:DNA ligase (NAD+)
MSIDFEDLNISTVDEYTAAITAALAAADAYYNTDVELEDDAVYDQRLRDIEAFEAAFPAEVIDHPLFTAVAAGTATTGTIVHTRPMLSLEKANTAAEVEAFVNRVGADLDFITEPKLDGLAINLVYIDGKLVSAATRADGLTGEDMSRNIDALRVNALPRTINEVGYVEVRGELVMSTEDFRISNAARVASGKPAFKNPRNAAVGTLRRKTIGYDAQVTFVAYDAVVDVHEGYIDSHAEAMMWLRDMGFTSAYSLLRQTGDRRYKVLDRVRDFGEMRDERGGDAFAYPTDGIVIILDDYKERRRLGATSSAPRYAIAFKYEAEKTTTTVLDIEVAVGRTGAISYTAVLDPVFIDGSVVGRATLHNPRFIAEHDIRIGSVVNLKKANDVIPRVEHAISHAENSVPYEPSTLCPISGTPLDRSGEIWRSTDPAASIGALINYAASRDALDIDGLGTEIADALVSGDNPVVADLSDIFRLQFQQLANLRLADSAKGGARYLGAAVATKLIANIEAAKSQPLNRIITALGIRKSGRTFGRRLAAHFHTMDALLDTTEAQFLASGVEGVGPERARLFHEGFQRNRPVIEKMRAAGVNMGDEPVADDSADTKAKHLAGMKIVVTGAMSGPLAALNRTEVAELIEANGGQASGSVSKTTDLLVCGEPGSSKFVKAEALGVRIVTPTEFAEMVGRS